MTQGGEREQEGVQARLARALGRFRAGYNCAQSVLYAHCDDLELDRDTALRLACGLGAGMGRSQEVCGAVSGGILVLGLRHGRGEQEDRGQKETTYARTRALMAAFEQRHGTCICRQLLSGCDLTTAEGQDLFRDNDLLERVCVPCVASVMAILAELR